MISDNYPPFRGLFPNVGLGYGVEYMSPGPFLASSFPITLILDFRQGQDEQANAEE